MRYSNYLRYSVAANIALAATFLVVLSPLPLLTARLSRLRPWWDTPRKCEKD